MPQSMDIEIPGGAGGIDKKTMLIGGAAILGLIVFLTKRSGSSDVSSVNAAGSTQVAISSVADQLQQVLGGLSFVKQTTDKNLLATNALQGSVTTLGSDLHLTQQQIVDAQQAGFTSLDTIWHDLVQRMSTIGAPNFTQNEQAGYNAFHAALRAGDDFNTARQKAEAVLRGGLQPVIPGNSGVLDGELNWVSDQLLGGAGGYLPSAEAYMQVVDQFRHGLDIGGGYGTNIGRAA